MCIVLSDNTQTVPLLKRGTTKKLGASSWLERVFYSKNRNNFPLHAVHAAGINNVAVDALSRLTKSLNTKSGFLKFSRAVFLETPYQLESFVASKTSTFKLKLQSLLHKALASPRKRTRLSQWKSFEQFC